MFHNFLFQRYRYGTSSSATLSKAERLLLASNYYGYKMCCFKREMCAPERLIDSKAWCPLNFLLELLSS